MAPTGKISLTQLPQHILSQILTYAIADVSPRRALRLRLTNKTLNHEILHVVFERNSFTFHTNLLPNEVTIFRYVRGFLLRRECEEKLFALRQNLLEAAILLTNLAKSLEPSDHFSGDFVGLYETKSEQNPSEEVIAALITSAVQYVGGSVKVCRLWARARVLDTVEDQTENDAASHHSGASEASDVDSQSDQDSSSDRNENSDDNTVDEPADMRGPWTVLASKNINFWVLLTAARFGKLDMAQKSLTALRESYGPEINLAHDLQAVLQLPVQQGHDSVIRFLLEQPELAQEHLPQSFVLNNETALERAIKAEKVSTVKLLLASGWDIAPITTEYTSALMYSIRHTNDAAIREEFVRVFLQLTQEWRSSSMTGGIFKEICAKSDPELAKVVLQLIKESTMDLAQFTREWTLPDRHDVWSAESDHSAMYNACESGSTELVKFLFDNQTHLPRSMKQCFRLRNIRACLEHATATNNHELLMELLKHRKNISLKKLLAYATIKSDLDTVKLLAKDVDIHARVETDRYFQGYVSGSGLFYAISASDLDRTTFLNDKANLTVGSFCLVLAIRLLKTEIAEFFITENVRIGTQLTFIARNFFSNQSIVLAEDTSSIGSRALILTYKHLYFTDCKLMLGRGAPNPFRKALVLSKPPKPENQSRWKRFLTRGWKIQTQKVLEDIEARVVSSIQVPCMHYERGKWQEMWKLLKKHRLPSIYMDADDF